MPQTLKVACAALNQTPLDFEGNLQNILAAIKAAKKEGVSLLLLPEMCISGYGCEDAFLSEEVSISSKEQLAKIAKKTKGIAVSVGLPIYINRDCIFNTACLFVDGEIVGFVSKQVLPIHGIHYESRWFVPGEVGDIREIEVAGKNYPLGDLVFSFNGIRVAYEICRDSWVEDRPLKRLSKNGVSIVLNPSASHFAFGRHQERQKLIRDSAKDYRVNYLYANLLGNEAGSIIYDGCTFIGSPDGSLVEGERFGFSDFELVVADVGAEQRKVEVEHPNVIKVDFNLAGRGGARPLRGQSESRSTSFNRRNVGAGLRPGPLVDMQNQNAEFIHAVSLGLFDYLRKSKLEGFVVSLSGGADSATVACLVHFMCELGVSNLGLEGFIKKLSHIKSIQAASSVEGIKKELLTCVYQSTRNSSETTANAAKTVANGIGASFAKIDVDDLVQKYTELAESVIARDLSWESDGLALQNIQARVRAPGIWLVANAKNALLLATSNRSEISVGYATMDGDTAGGISPIGGVDKVFILNFLKFLEKEMKMTFLNAVTSQRPTAELKPKEQDQTDEADLMPYVVLNEIEKLVVKEKFFLEKTKEEIIPLFPNYNKDELEAWVDKFFRLYKRSQWKRERYAPSFFLDDRSLDPRTWHRFPVLSG